MFDGIHSSTEVSEVHQEDSNDESFEGFSIPKEYQSKILHLLDQIKNLQRNNQDLIHNLTILNNSSLNNSQRSEEFSGFRQPSTQTSVATREETLLSTNISPITSLSDNIIQSTLSHSSLDNLVLSPSFSVSESSQSSIRQFLQYHVERSAQALRYYGLSPQDVGRSNSSLESSHLSLEPVRRRISWRTPVVEEEPLSNSLEPSGFSGFGEDQEEELRPITSSCQETSAIIGFRPMTRSQGKCLELPNVQPHMLERKRKS